MKQPDTLLNAGVVQRPHRAVQILGPGPVAPITVQLSRKSRSKGPEQNVILQRGEAMRLIALAVILAAAAGVTIWRGIDLYNYGLHKKDL